MIAISTIVVSALPQLEKRFLRSQPRTPASSTGGASWRRSPWATSAMSALRQRNALVVPVHEGRDRQADGEIGRHDDQDVLDRLTGLVDSDVHRGHQVGKADGDGERGVFGDA